VRIQQRKACTEAHLQVYNRTQEFQPWIKWLIFDALVTLAIGALLRRYKGLRPALEALGLA